jgi:hypothetical protein
MIEGVKLKTGNRTIERETATSTSNMACIVMAACLMPL